MPSIPDGLELTPFNDRFYQDPYPVYEELRRLDPVHKDQQSFYGNSWTISDYGLVRELLTDHRLSVDPRSIGLRMDPRADNPVTLREPNMMNLDGGDHRRLRSLVQQAFTPKTVESFRADLQNTAQACLAAMPETFDLVKVLSKPMPTIAIAKFIGVDASKHEDFKRWTDSLTKRGYPVPTEEQWQEIVAADEALRSYLTQVVAERSTAPEGDLVSRLIAARDESQQLSTDEIVEVCFLLIGAGNFTTTDLISNCIYADLTSEENLEAKSLVEHTLRYDSSVLAVRRYVTEEMSLQGKTIARGSVVNLLIAAANHDEAAQGQYLSFGRGIHHCLGAPLAKIEAEVAVKVFREQFPNARLVSARRSKRMDFRGFGNLEVATKQTIPRF